MSPHNALRCQQIQPFHVMELLRRARELEAQGRDIVHMEVGEPDFPTPAPIVEAATRFLSAGEVQYTGSLGLPALREAIAGHYRERFGLEVDPCRIAVTPGASGALMLAIAALTDVGDVWQIPDPGYPSNRHFVRAFEGIARALPVSAGADFQPTPEQVAEAWCERCRGLMVASPANPTGTMLDPESLSRLAATVGERGGALLVDEIYQGLSYGIDPTTALAVGQDLFVVNSFSKYFGMTGWRLGWLVVPEGFERQIEKLAQHFFICPSTVAQHAALAAFSPATREILETRRAEFARRRDLLLPALEALGFGVPARPSGAFYVYADVSRLSEDSEALARLLIEQAGVATTPGLDFGTHLPRRHLRFAYTTAATRLEEGLARIGRVLGQS
ncbi:MAG: pyridoxal phosphate-dependent aminotransferase [Rhodocyclaceae bacterium]|nr:pyridoxal phosphate-dependent aminotransferase [Rhodocyclaceae bacterium]